MGNDFDAKLFEPAVVSMHFCSGRKSSQGSQDTRNEWFSSSGTGSVGGSQ